jgi:CheY-like chemotaxis protein
VAPSTPALSLRVLVVDDCADARGTLRILLRLWGYEAREVADGPAALTEAAAWRPEVVLCDIGLPGLDGYEVARRLRARAGGEALLLVAVSGHGREQDVAEALRAGFDRHLLKPFDPGELKGLLESRRTPRPRA